MKRGIADAVDCVDVGVRVQQHLDAPKFFPLTGEMEQALALGRFEVGFGAPGDQELQQVFGRGDIGGDDQGDGTHLGLVAYRGVGASLQ